MTLPNFLVIGCKRAGSTLLHELLARHQQVYVPTRRKELWFFDVNWENGLTWYEGFFPHNASTYRAVGEVSPGYLFHDRTPDRVKDVLGAPLLVVMARHPARQAWSWWHHDCGKGFRGSFQDWLNNLRIEELRTGYHLERWLKLFPRRNFLVMVLEEFIAAPRTHLSLLARHLQVVDDWPGWRDLLDRGVNRSVSPSRTGIILRGIARRARQAGFNRLVNTGKRCLSGVLKEGPGLAMPSHRVTEITELFRDDIRSIEAILGRKLLCWDESVVALKPTHLLIG